MTDKEFLNWIIDRFVHVYNESPNVDFIHRLQNIANKLEFLEKYKATLRVLLEEAGESR